LAENGRVKKKAERGGGKGREKKKKKKKFPPDALEILKSCGHPVKSERRGRKKRGGGEKRGRKGKGGEKI